MAKTKDAKKLYISKANTLHQLAQKALLAYWADGYLMLCSDDVAENKRLADALVVEIYRGKFRVTHDDVCFRHFRTANPCRHCTEKKSAAIKLSTKAYFERI